MSKDFDELDKFISDHALEVYEIFQRSNLSAEEQDNECEKLHHIYKTALAKLLKVEVAKAKKQLLEELKDSKHWMTETRDDGSTMSGWAVLIPRINTEIATLTAEVESDG